MTSYCFCTLAIHGPYRQRARALIQSALAVPWVVITDQLADFAELPVRAIAHTPTGPMATDYLARLPATGAGRGAAAYHDKRFALLAALEQSDTAIYLDADSLFQAAPADPLHCSYPAGLAVLPVVQRSIADHLEQAGSWRMAGFEALAQRLFGTATILQSAVWCHEALLAVTKDGNENRFFEAWSIAAAFMQERAIYSGEGGVIGLAAAYAGWRVDYEALQRLGAVLQHEGGGPKGG
jgi:hypothetical protein